MNRKNDSMLELKFCDIKCVNAESSGRGACNTFNLINCDKYGRQVDKGQPCQYYSRKNNK